MRTLLAVGLCLSLGAQAGAAEIQSIQPNKDTGSAAAVIVGETALAHTAQLLPLARDGSLVGKGDAAAQAEKVLDNLATALAEVRSGLDQAVKVNVYVARPEVAAAVTKTLAQRFRGDTKPAVCLVVTPLADPDALVAMDAVAATVLKGDAVQRVRAAALPGAAGEHQVAVLPIGPKIYISGQAEKGDFAEGTRLTMASLGRTLEFLKRKPEDVVQVKAFLRQTTALPEVRKEIVRFFGESVPPLVFVEGDAGLPVEIEMVVAGDGRVKAREPIEYLTPPELKASPLFSRVARINHGRTIFVSGLYGNRAEGAAEQIEEIYGALKTLLEKNGSDLRHMAKATYYVTDAEASRKLNEIRPKFYDPKRPPAASKVTVTGVGPKGKVITIDMIAVTAP